MRIILLGAPGAGKGTQAQQLSARYGIPAISTGNIIRENLEMDTELGRKAKSYMESGALVPDQLVIEIIRKRLSAGDCEKGFILDGFPRTVSQAKALDDMGVFIDRVICMEVTEEVIVRRMSGRRVCRECGFTYHVKTNPSPAGDACGNCGGALTTRADDRPETVKERLRVFYEQTAPLKEYYEKSGRLVTVDGGGTVENTNALVTAALEAQEL